jgi:pimeloyl-ACP methyl ester carboxylesterase
MMRSPLQPLLGGTVQEFYWNWKGTPIRVAYEVLGEGPPVLLLPAFSTISSRTEMRGLAWQLAQRFQVFAIDWVGFGQSDRPPIDYRPALYHGFLRDFVKEQFKEPVVVIAAGHAAGYVMHLVQQQPDLWSYIILTTPTWRGPLPTMLKGKRRWLPKFVRRLINMPVLGQLLYGLNTLPWFLRWMMGRHVYGDRAHITREILSQKHQLTQQRNARFASAAFVTGGLDPIHSRTEFIDYFQPLPVPALMVIGEQTPPKSREEMEVIVHFSGVQVYRMPGTLGLHEEYADDLMAGILPFLHKFLSQKS